MKTITLAMAAVIGLGAGSALAGEGGGPTGNTWFTQLPGVVAQVPGWAAPTAVAQNPDEPQQNATPPRS